MVIFLKAITAVIIQVIVVMLCRSKAGFYRNRPIVLRQIVYSLQIISNQMVFSNELLPDVVHRMSQGVNYPVRKLWECTNVNLREDNMKFTEAFGQAICELKAELCLTDDDVHCLELLSTQLGQSDLHNQLDILKITIDKLLSLEHQSEKEKKQQVKLWNMLGVLGGMSIVILLW